MRNFFPSPFPYFRHGLGYYPYRNNHLSNNHPNNIKNFKNPEIYKYHDNSIQVPENIEKQTSKKESTLEKNTKKNSITNEYGNTISSILPFQLSNFIPNNIGPLHINFDGFYNINNSIFDLFGIRLFLDDIIIICILIFLFQEDVKDEMLYLILIMLLLS